MTFHYLSLIFLVMSFILLSFCTILLWRQIKISHNKENQLNYCSRLELDALESNVNNKIDHIMNLLTSQNSLISVISNTIGISGKKREIHEDGDDEKEMEKDAQSFHKASSGFGGKGTVYSSDHKDVEKKMESLLNSADFMDMKWQEFSKPFNQCADILAAYLAENGIPLPRIEPYPALKDDNPHHWIFMIVQAQTWRTESKRFLIPRNYYRYNPLWHDHLFNILGSTKNADNFINGLKKCAILKNGIISGYIDKSLVETKGIITVE